MAQGEPLRRDIGARAARRKRRRGARLRKHVGLAGAGFAGMVVIVLAASIPHWPAPDALAPQGLASQAQFAANQGGSQQPIYYGVHVPGWLSDLSGVLQFEADAGKPVSIIMNYQGWGLADGSQNFQPAWMDNIRTHGAIPMVTWEPWLYTDGVNQPRFALRNIIGGAFDGYITAWARASAAWGHPYFLRFAPEMNGNWFSWSEQANGNASGEYVAAWHHVHDLFAAAGATNVSWVWCPNIEYAGSAPLGPLYPGDAYVDWLGMDGYNWGTSAPGKSWQTFAQVFGPTYTRITALSAKPLLIAETASAEAGGSKAAWIADAFDVAIPQQFPRIRGVVWFNENKETDWRIESSPAAQAAFAQAISSPRYTTNTYGSLDASPIPPP